MEITQIKNFSHSDIGEIRGFTYNGRTWFLAGSVCDCLKLKDSGRQVKAIEERFRIAELKGPHTMRPLIQTSGGKQKVLVISESVFYELIFQSRKQSAIKFRAWVTNEVLPELRRTGEYRILGKEKRCELTEAILLSGENERMHGHGFSNYTKLVYKSLGLPNKIDRDNIPEEMLEKIAQRENLVQALIKEGKLYNDVKTFLESF